MEDEGRTGGDEGVGEEWGSSTLITETALRWGRVRSRGKSGDVLSLFSPTIYVDFYLIKSWKCNDTIRPHGGDEGRRWPLLLTDDKYKNHQIFINILFCLIYFLFSFIPVFGLQVNLIYLKKYSFNYNILIFLKVDEFGFFLLLFYGFWSDINSFTHSFLQFHVHPHVQTECLKERRRKKKQINV